MLFQQIPACEREDKLKGTDDDQKVNHKAYRCRDCGRFPVIPCKSCSLQFCKQCIDQHHCTPKSVTGVHPNDDKGNRRFAQNAIFPDMQKCDSM